MEAPQRNHAKTALSIEACEVTLNGRVPPHLQSRLVVETIKHLLYQREQIPMPYEHLKRRYVTKEQKDHSRLSLSSECKKCLQCLETIDEHFQHLDDVFQITQVTRVMILFGSTAVTPKEMYLVNLHNLHRNYGSAGVTSKSGIRCLMRALITNVVLSEADSLCQTNVLVLVEAHRDSGLNWFKPKLSFKTPSRGKQFEIKFASTHSDEEVEDENAQFYDDDDLVWFQAPKPIKGFKLKAEAAPVNLFP
ncbi:MAD2L1-binding protein-like [Glandiceps talaboti]